MVFKRSLKTGIKKFCTKMCLIVVLFTTISVFVFNAVFAEPGIDIPVEIIWNDQGTGTRPGQVILHLRDASTGTDVVNPETLTIANKDPNNDNRWTHIFSVPNYDPTITYEVYEESINGFTVSGPTQPTITNSISVTDWHVGTPDQVSHGANHNIGNYTFALIEKAGNYILWTFTQYTGNDYNSLLNSIYAHYGSNVSITDYKYGASTSSSGITFRYYNNVLTLKITGNGTPQEFFYGNTTTSSSATVTLTNTINEIYNVSYAFTGDILPLNAAALLPGTAQYEPGDTVTVAAEPTASGYHFLGWQKDGSPISGTFSMPNTDVTITGSWEQFNGYFAPAIAIGVVDEPTYYRVLDTVNFTITVTNPESYPIHDVVVDELLSGATFTSGSGYTVVSDQQANIPTIAAGGSVTLYATYQIPRDVTETITNTVEITSATADNYYFFNATQDCIDSEDFEVRSWQDEPVVTGINSNSTTLYYVLMLTGAIGIGIGVVNIKNKKKITKGRK